MAERSARPGNRYIYVTTAGLPDECYTALGAVQFNEPFGDAAVDPDQSEAFKHLREAAMKSYPNDVDAVINVKSDQNDAGTEVTLSGQAVRLEDHPTVKCALRKSEPVLDTAAEIGAGGIAGATVGGLMSGTSGATAAGVGAAGTMAAHEAAQHQAAVEQQQEDFRAELAKQRREIKHLVQERAHLRKCREEEVSLSECLAEPAGTVNSAQARETSEDDGQNDTNATVFQMQKHLQEQQDFIRQLKDEISQLKWQLGAH